MVALVVGFFGKVEFVISLFTGDGKDLTLNLFYLQKRYGDLPTSTVF
jgi:hypothetical protein